MDFVRKLVELAFAFRGCDQQPSEQGFPFGRWRLSRNAEASQVRIGLSFDVHGEIVQKLLA